MSSSKFRFHRDFKYEIACDIVEVQNKRISSKPIKEYLVSDMPRVKLTFLGYFVDTKRARFGVIGLEIERVAELNLRYLVNRSGVEIAIIYMADVHMDNSNWYQ